MRLKSKQCDLAFLVFGGAAALFFSACNDPGKTFVSYCRGLDGMFITDNDLAARCCEGAGATQTKQDVGMECPQNPFGSVASAAGNVSDSVTAAQSNLRAANRLVSGALAETPGEQLKNKNAIAQAASAPPTTTNGSGGTPPGSSNVDNHFLMGKPKPDGASGAASNTSGSNVLASGGVSTPADNSALTEKARLAAQQAALEGNSSGSTYGGSGGKEKGTAKKPTLLSGQNAADALTGADGEISFDGKLGHDPAQGRELATDYFGRIQVNTSLFKVIEKRYQKQSRIWNLEIANEATFR